MGVSETGVPLNPRTDHHFTSHQAAMLPLSPHIHGCFTKCDVLQQNSATESAIRAQDRLPSNREHLKWLQCGLQGKWTKNAERPWKFQILVVPISRPLQSFRRLQALQSFLQGLVDVRLGVPQIWFPKKTSHIHKWSSLPICLVGSSYCLAFCQAALKIDK